MYTKNLETELARQQLGEKLAVFDEYGDPGTRRNACRPPLYHEATNRKRNTKWQGTRKIWKLNAQGNSWGKSWPADSCDDSCWLHSIVPRHLSDGENCDASFGDTEKTLLPVGAAWLKNSWDPIHHKNWDAYFVTKIQYMTLFVHLLDPSSFLKLWSPLIRYYENSIYDAFCILSQFEENSMLQWIRCVITLMKIQADSFTPSYLGFSRLRPKSLRWNADSSSPYISSGEIARAI